MNYIVLSLQNILTILSLLVILMLIFHVLGPIVLIYPRSCCRTISSLLIKCLTLTLPTIMMFIHAVPLLITFLLYLTMPISLILFLFLILSRISLTTYPYTSLPNFLTFSRFLVIFVRHSIIVVLLVTLTLLPTLQLTGLKSPHVMFHLTVTNFCPPYLNFLQISLIAVTQTALVTTLILTPTVYDFLTVLLLQLIYACLPKHRQCQRRSPLSGWNVAAQYLKQCAHFWHKVWTECGCPTSGVLIQIKKNSKRRFKYEVRRLHRHQSHIRREKLASAHLHSSKQEFWKLVKTISKSSRGTSTSSTANIVDGCCDDGAISNIFSSKLKTLLNSCTDTQPRNSLYDSIRESSGPSDLSSIFISQEVVRDAISQLKSGKHDGSILMSNHFIYAKDALSAPLSQLFTPMLRHGIVPDTLRDCILVPIPKPGKDPSSSDSYRPIALAPILSKVFEWCLIFQFQSCFITSLLQFGFKSGFSADLCTGLLKNVIHNYLECDSHVYGCFLDASKAFDRVNHVLLFEKLLQQNLPPAVARLLLSWYISQQLKVRWSNNFSEPFNTSNGVRQGGVISPILFTIYIDDLLSYKEVMLYRYRKGGRNRERNRRILRISLPCVLC